MDDAPNKQIKGFHELAKRWPKMPAEQYAEFKADIEKNGIRNPILIDGQGLVVDGVHRVNVSVELKLPIADDKIEVTLLTGTALEALTYGLNLQRRHLTDAQRTQMAADFMLASRGTDSEMTMEETAAMTKTSPRSLSDSSTLRQNAPELADAVLAGDISSHAAKQAMHKSPEEQAALIEKKKSAALEKRDPAKRQKPTEASDRNWKRSVLVLPGKGNRVEKLQDYVACLPKLAREIEDITRIIDEDEAPDFDGTELWSTLQRCVLKSDFAAVKSAVQALIEAIKRNGAQPPASPDASPASGPKPTGTPVGAASELGGAQA